MFSVGEESALAPHEFSPRGNPGSNAKDIIVLNYRQLWTQIQQIHVVYFDDLAVPWISKLFKRYYGMLGA